MSRLRGRVAERGVDLASEQKLACFQQQWSTEMHSMQSQLLSLATRIDEVVSKNSSTSTVLLDLYCSFKDYFIVVADALLTFISLMFFFV